MASASDGVAGVADAIAAGSTMGALRAGAVVWPAARAELGPVLSRTLGECADGLCETAAGVGATGSGGRIAERVVKAMVGIDKAKEVPNYFAPLCEARLLSVRHYNGESSRVAGDCLHMMALVFCLGVLLRDVGTDGVSFKAHLLFLIVFTARFLNVMFCDQSVYLIIYKVLLWTSTLKIVMIMFFRGSPWDTMDTLPICVLVMPTAILTLVFGSYSQEDHGLAFEVLWIFSNYLEGLAMLPQYIYCYRDCENDSWLVLLYVFTMGAYRMVYGLNWLYYAFSEGYLDISSVLSGVLGIVFFADYVAFKASGTSPLSHFCTYVDEELRDAQEVAIELAQGKTPESFEEFATGGISPCSGVMIGKPVQEVELHYLTNSADDVDDWD